MQELRELKSMADKWGICWTKPTELIDPKQTLDSWFLKMELQEDVQLEIQATAQDMAHNNKKMLVVEMSAEVFKFRCILIILM